MLIYNPIYDLFHCTFRQLQILQHVTKEIQVEKLRILDFYLAFPSEILRIRLPKEAHRYRKFLHDLENPYELIIDIKRIFLNMEPYQISTLKFLVSLGIIDQVALEDNIVIKTNLQLPKMLLEQIEIRNRENAQIMNFITQFLMKLNLNGPAGLKARTNLMEYKYDLL